ncbi:hypothetical protein GALMADRAFT_153825 [Galerina marginata CBS 339.88]|uniref:CSC1/OSCA1-like 7TM region domain-containing protein n=1 Tax=Galerina marginata (strain CBS 339.88) TaxID=685588 RepID=A0A067TAG5_GALM3|nr:hypothetical protein GALMADRAFT_153825 [Galerina marginata CBS 339.88]
MSNSTSSIQNAKSASTSTFVTALVFNAAVFGIELAVFTVLRPYFKAIYEPRTYVPKPAKRAKPLSRNMFLWPFAVFRSDYRAIIAANGLDAYFFVRFLRLMAIILVPIWLVSWAVLLPLTSVNTSVAGLSGLDKFTFGNVAPNKQGRYAGHLLLVYFFTFWIFYNIKREMRHFIITRQQHLIEHTHSKSVQANTILITGIPKKFLTQDALYKLFNELPGGVRRIWINRNLKELPDIYDRRMAACNKLESAETALLRTAAKLRLKALKKQGKSGEAQKAAPADVEASIARAEFEVPESERPTHKLGKIPFTGKKVDTINWARDEIEECTRLLEEGRDKIRQSDERGSSEPVDPEDEIFQGSAVDADGNPRLRTGDVKYDPMNVGRKAVKGVEGVAKGTVSGVSKGAEAIKGRVVGPGGLEGEYPPLNSAFVTFNKQISAHLAVQVLAHHEPYRMSNRYIEVAPNDVIWANLGMNPYEQKVRIAISYAATAALIIFWAIPVAFVGVISNVHTLCTTAKFLAWICDLPAVVVGIISGILPPVLLAVLMMLLPIVLRLLARFEGIPKYTGLELSLMSRFFIFQVVHSFLIVTLSSGIVSSLHDILNNPTSIPTILAQNLPKASTFFLTYIILQGLSGVAGGFLQIVPLIIYYVKLFILGSTPRSVYGIKYGLGSVAWGTLFPSVTLLVVITLGYSIISPIINGLACATFFMFYQLYKYLFLYVYQQPPTTDTGGLFFPKALQHVFVGLYVQQICLCALFFLARNENIKASAIPEGALMIVLIVITAGFQIIINNSYGPLLTALPLSLQNRTFSGPGIEDKNTNQATSSNPDVDTHREDSRSQAPSIEEEDVDLNSHKHKEKDERKATPPPKDAADEAAEEDEESYGFAHPAASRPQRTVWIPRDVLGLSEEEVRGNREKGVRVSEMHADMDESGKVDIMGGPPDLI